MTVKFDPFTGLLVLGLVYFTIIMPMKQKDTDKKEPEKVVVTTQQTNK